jgi:hypothetical protein
MKLDDIKKKNIYTVPDKYFDQLPARIQSRVNEKDPVSALHWNWGWWYKLAIPAIAVVFLIIYFGRIEPDINQDAESILAQVSTEDVIAYLADIDISTSDIIESFDLNNIEFDFTKKVQYFRISILKEM